MTLLSRRAFALGLGVMATPVRAQVVQNVNVNVNVHVHVVLIPEARAHAGAAFDTTTGEFVLCGGYVFRDGAPKAAGDIWAWNGERWRILNGDNKGTYDARIVPAMAYDSKRSRLLMFGGFADQAADNGRLMVLDDGKWRLLSDDPAMARGGPAMIYDNRRDRVVLFGGRHGQTELSDTWEFDGEKWAQTWKPGPSLRDPTSMTYDEDRGVTVLYGGFRPLDALDDPGNGTARPGRRSRSRAPAPAPGRAWPTTQSASASSCSPAKTPTAISVMTPGPMTAGRGRRSPTQARRRASSSSWATIRAAIASSSSVARAKRAISATPGNSTAHVGPMSRLKHPKADRRGHY